MNKRQRNKRHNQLKAGIRRLHDDIARDEGLPRSTDKEIDRLARKLGTSRRLANQTLKNDRRYAKRQKGR